MASFYDLFSDQAMQRRRSRLGGVPFTAEELQAFRTGNPIAAGPEQAANPQPQFQPVSSLPGQTNVDASIGSLALEGLQNWVTNQRLAGTSFLPTPTPMLNYREERDPNTGDYVSRSYEAEWSGVPDAIRTAQQMYLEPIVGRANASIASENATRERVRAATQPFQQYSAPRLSRSFNPSTGQSMTSLVNDSLPMPFIPLSAYYRA